MLPKRELGRIFSFESNNLQMQLLLNISGSDCGAFYPAIWVSEVTHRTPISPNY